ncbi:methyltransferase domain-containing protein [Kitasatospora sp. NPDC088134]|uniref:methyltransferase domain-containing protein n=1 Tax=Kitasatospora sp. NPDC088134 TaxID=3364071 RepID=UPI00380F2957
MTTVRFTAAQWNDSYTDGIVFTGLRPQEQAALAEHAPVPAGGGRALDVGCGTGELAAHLASQGWTVDAIDLSAAALERARAAHPDAAVRWLEADVEDADLPHLLGDDPYLLITLRLSVAFLTDRANALHRLGRLLAPGGTLLVTTPLAATTPPERRRIALDDDEIAALTSGWSEVRRLDAGNLAVLVLRGPHRDTVATERSTPATGNVAVAGALAVVTDEQGRVLLGWSARGMWELPGGKIDMVADGDGGARAESLEEAAVRELAEEAGLQAGGAAVVTVLLDHAQQVPRLTGVVRGVDVTGTPTVREPDKFVRWEWVDVCALDGLGPVFTPTAQALDAIWPGTVSRLPAVSSYPHDTPAPAAPGESAEAARRRAEMAERVGAANPHLPGPVVAALRAVPRHRFVPAARLSDAYDPHEPHVTLRDAAGAATSSVSAASLQALMAHQARITPGARILELGSGGANAALLAHLAGPTGHVVTVDADERVVHRTRRALAETSTTRVTPVLGDGTLGAPEHLVPPGGFDAIVATYGLHSVPRAWPEQLAPGGRLVVPLELHTPHRWSIALHHEGDTLVSEGPWLPCGFIRDSAGPHVPSTRLADDVLLWHPDGPPPDTDGIAEALHTPRHRIPTGVRTAAGAPFDTLHLHLLTALHTSGYCSIQQEPATDAPTALAPGRTEPALIGPGSLAYLTTEPADEGWEFTVHGHGDRATAERLADAVRHWDRHLRTAGHPRLTVHPDRTRTPPTGTPFVRKNDVLLTLDWPATAGGTA